MSKKTKFNLQHRLWNRHGLRVTVAHYPPATSKWNPIEHRLFCEVAKNSAARPLDSYESILKYLRRSTFRRRDRLRRSPISSSAQPVSARSVLSATPMYP